MPFEMLIVENNKCVVVCKMRICYDVTQELIILTQRRHICFKSAHDSRRPRTSNLFPFAAKYNQLVYAFKIMRRHELFMDLCS